MSNILFQKALKRENQKTPPIWFMRQAGRYHSHYQKLKEKYSFEQLCKTPDLAAEVASGPVKEFDYDEVNNVMDLGIGKCKLSVAHKKDFFKKKQRNGHLMIATKYKNTVTDYFA